MKLQLDPAKVTAALEAAGVPESVREEVTERVLSILQEVMVSRLDAELTDVQREELARLADNSDLDKASDWIRHRFPHYDQMVDESLQDIIADAKKTLADIDAA